jgi:hypothetical protein
MAEECCPLCRRCYYALWAAQEAGQFTSVAAVQAVLGDRVALGRSAADSYAARCWRHEGESGELADWCAAWFEGWQSEAGQG